MSSQLELMPRMQKRLLILVTLWRGHGGCIMWSAIQPLTKPAPGMVSAPATGALGTLRWEGHSFVHKVSTQNLLETWLYAEMWGDHQEAPLHCDPWSASYNSQLSTSSAVCGDVCALPHSLQTDGGSRCVPGHSRVNIRISSITTHLTRVPELPPGHNPCSLVHRWECPRERDATCSEQRTMGTPSLPVDTMLQLLYNWRLQGRPGYMWIHSGFGAVKNF